MCGGIYRVQVSVCRCSHWPPSSSLRRSRNLSFSMTSRSISSDMLELKVISPQTRRQRRSRSRSNIVFTLPPRHGLARWHPLTSRNFPAFFAARIIATTSRQFAGCLKFSPLEIPNWIHVNATADAYKNTKLLCAIRVLMKSLKPHCRPTLKEGFF